MSTKRSLTSNVVSTALLLCCVLHSTISRAESVAQDARLVTPARKQELTHLLKQDCGSCHGMTLKGGLGPSLLPVDLSSRDIETLSQKILHGTPEKGMPPWRALLSEQDARWLATLIITGVGAL